MGYSKVFEKFKGRVVGAANKVIEALNRKPPEVEVGRHAASLVACFNHIHFMAVAQRMVCGGKPHWACTDDDDFRQDSPQLSALRKHTE